MTRAVCEPWNEGRLEHRTSKACAYEEGLDTMERQGRVRSKGTQLQISQPFWRKKKSQVISHKNM